jgi:antitoxin component YwqK of YwqJK toxin-antitoxin module
VAQDRVEIRKRYYKSGALWWETPYVDGRMHGIEKEYYESGDLDRETPYDDGKMHGIEKYYGKDTSNIDYIILYEKGHEVTSVKFSI